MKKKFPLVLIAIILLIALKTCSSELFMSSEKLIAKGDIAMENKEYDQAIEYYQRAGAAGNEKERKAHLAKTGRMTYEDTITYLQENASDLFTEEEIYAIILNQRVEEWENFISEIEVTQEEYYTKIENETDYDKINEHYDNLRSYYIDKFRKLKDNLEIFPTLIPANTDGLEELLNEEYYYAGKLSLWCNEENYYTEAYWRNTLDLWSNCTAGPGYEITQAIEQITSKNNMEGFATISFYIEDLWMLNSLTKHLREQIAFENVQESLDYEIACRTLFPQESFDFALSEAYYNAVKIGTAVSNIELELNPQQLDEIKNTCGTEPSGKILFLHQVDGKIYFHDLTFTVPNAHMPANLESVEYVVLMSAEDIETGNTFEKGTKEIREDITLTLYHAPTGNILYQEIIDGPTDFIISYYGDPPEYWRAGAPNISDELMSLLAIIEQA